tara:strand:- start:135 stop:392 length:258 start_codon:yes stop_codon:yes gene_type:complete
MTEEVNAAAEEAAPQLTLGDIATVVQIIDLVSRRGGFEGQELETVGALRSRVVKFLDANKPADGEAPEGQVPVAEEVEAEAEADA